METRTELCDLLVVGSGAAGLTAAIAARKAGLQVIVVEKEDLFGGTTALSGGMIWIPGNRHSVAANAKSGKDDSIDIARKYILDEGRGYVNPERVEAYLTYGREMVDFLERESEVKFYSMDYPDYVSANPHSRTQRGLCTETYQTSKLGEHLKTLRNQLPQTLFLGLAIGSSVEMKEFMRAGRSLKSLGFVMKKLVAHARDMVLYGRSEQMVRGRALVGRLARTVLDLEIPMWLNSPLRRLISENDAIRGAIIDTPTGPVRVLARRGVVLACGGYGRDDKRRAASYPKVAGGLPHPTPVPLGNTGDGVRLAESVGGRFDAHVTQIGSWMPVSQMPGVSGIEGVWPHLVDRMKPGFIAVSRKGKRFVNESSSYHHFVQGMIAVNEQEGASEAAAWLVADSRTVKRWGMGFVRPFPVPKGKYVRNGYLIKADSLAELASKTGIDPQGLQDTVRDFNAAARAGKDPLFHRGESVYDSYQGDDEVKPNSCLSPVEQGPFYAVRLYVGEIGTFAGIAVDACARVLDQQGQPLKGLYAVGNDQASVFGGAYPGPGSTIGPGMTFGYIAGRHAAGVHV
ncbi:3-oxosteroid 1-dehydrogenase [Rhodoferax lacus]|uniref:3-oxosteroid 1-dehydrogenase n=1 Tax=Rhodoferax lacus TaxID=2184758 RepID=A0A3E1R7U1_9BURK|nr:FAD-dependent oxidoreductase [Rhodoferax lacus]RFO95261.1 3-oxosteroid 1-dehydrogenase [Rhodoferax lacus]